MTKFKIYIYIYFNVPTLPLPYNFHSQLISARKWPYWRAWENPKILKLKPSHLSTFFLSNCQIFMRVDWNLPQRFVCCLELGNHWSNPELPRGLGDCNSSSIANPMTRGEKGLELVTSKNLVGLSTLLPHSSGKFVFKMCCNYATIFFTESFWWLDITEKFSC